MFAPPSSGTLHFDSDDVDGMFLLQQKSTARRTRVKRSSSALFMAGLEGSGHHLWVDLVQALYNETHERTLPIVLKQAWLPRQYVDPQTGMLRDVSWQCRHKWKRTDIDLGVELFKNITSHMGDYGQAHYDEDVFWVTPEAMSYPCGAGTHEQKRDDFIPRVDWLAEAAASVDGLELHIGFMYRPLQQLLLANCIHRKLEHTCDLYAETMIINAHALLGQLRTINAMPKSKAPLVQCLPYGDMVVYPRGLGVLFNHKMSFDSILRQIWQPSVGDHHYGVDPRDLVPNWDQLVESLHSVDAEMKAACENADRQSGV